MKKARDPFSISCIECDGGMGIESAKEAKLHGWVNIFRDDGPSWNDLGTCPDCQLHEATTHAVAFAKRAWYAVDPSEHACQKAWPKLTEEARNAKLMLKEAVEIGRALCRAEENVKKQNDCDEKERSLSASSRLAT